MFYLEKKHSSLKSGVLLPTVLFFLSSFLMLLSSLFDQTAVPYFLVFTLVQTEFCCRMLFVRGSKVASKKLVFLIWNFQNLNVAPTHIFVHYMLYRPDKVSQTSKKNRAWLHTEPNMIKFNMTPDVKKGL